MGRMTGCERTASRKQKKAMNTHETAAACGAAFIASLLDRSSADRRATIATQQSNSVD